jgi:hypothetical protein
MSQSSMPPLWSYERPVVIAFASGLGDPSTDVATFIRRG